MRIIKEKTNNKFLNIKEVIDIENNIKGYQFAERKGINSIAFVGYNKELNKFLLNLEATPPINKYLLRAFGGSIDKDKPYLEIVKDEVLEEAGFKVKDKDVHFVGKVFVSTQMNQYCYLYLVNLDKNAFKGRKPENKIEASAKPKWKTRREIIKNSDWKAITIISKAKQLKIL